MAGVSARRVTLHGSAALVTFLVPATVRPILRPIGRHVARLTGMPRVARKQEEEP
jgi:hypothetical protein